MKVCIAEKPSVAKDIAAIIGANTRKDGYYEGNGYQVTWTFGHLCTLKEPNDYLPEWKYWDLRKLRIGRINALFTQVQQLWTAVDSFDTPAMQPNPADGEPATLKIYPPLSH